MPPVLAFINPRLTTQNVGDLFIEDSVKRILVYDQRNSIEIDPRRTITDEDIRRINSTRAAVIVGTNLWYRDMPKAGRWMFTLEQLQAIRVPIVPLGVGTTRHTREDNGFTAQTLAQIRHIHASCPEASARDGRTAETLEQAGIRNVRMTGCPTLYRSLSPDWRLRRRADGPQVAVTVRKGQRGNVVRLLNLLRQRNLAPVIAAQQRPDNFLRPWLPLLPAPAPTLYEYDLAPYLGLLERSRGAIGWRLHGNMLHLAHGNPAVFFANCSRAQSFCETFGVPYTFCPDGKELTEGELAASIERLHDPAAFDRLPGLYARYRGEMARFLEANGLEHNLHGAAAAAA